MYKEIKIEDTFRDDFMQALYEVRRAFLKNNLPVPKEIVLGGGYEMEMRMDYDVGAYHMNFRDGANIMGIKVRVIK